MLGRVLLLLDENDILVRVVGDGVSADRTDAENLSPGHSALTDFALLQALQRARFPGRITFRVYEILLIWEGYWHNGQVNNH